MRNLLQYILWIVADGFSFLVVLILSFSTICGVRHFRADRILALISFAILAVAVIYNSLESPQEPWTDNHIQFKPNTAHGWISYCTRIPRDNADDQGLYQRCWLLNGVWLASIVAAVLWFVLAFLVYSKSRHSFFDKPAYNFEDEEEYRNSYNGGRGGGELLGTANAMSNYNQSRDYGSSPADQAATAGVGSAYAYKIYNANGNQYSPKMYSHLPPNGTPSRGYTSSPYPYAGGANDYYTPPQSLPGAQNDNPLNAYHQHGPGLTAAAGAAAAGGLAGGGMTRHHNQDSPSSKYANESDEGDYMPIQYSAGDMPYSNSSNGGNSATSYRNANNETANTYNSMNTYRSQGDYRQYLNNGSINPTESGYVQRPNHYSYEGPDAINNANDYNDSHSSQFTPIPGVIRSSDALDDPRSPLESLGGDDQDGYNGSRTSFGQLQTPVGAKASPSSAEQYTAPQRDSWLAARRRGGEEFEGYQEE
ncbi:hypothetical protein BZG36_00243 [Bifiguratus adelaidae]|uniref:Uncharacterized protein n=1 Tax=Bifiguratus adelaidae TaxID=1938954 RepID=A0A261Y8P9_9FUNG|nr:hypothetical protein BZG36_00243 [Bifiguratus adelaidae]